VPVSGGTYWYSSRCLSVVGRTGTALGACQWWDTPVQLVVGQTASKSQFVPRRNHTASRIVVCCIVTPLSLLSVPQSFESTVSIFRVNEKDVRRSDIGSVVSPSGTTEGL
jgi:hypothetical protein